MVSCRVELLGMNFLFEVLMCTIVLYSPMIGSEGLDLTERMGRAKVFEAVTMDSEGVDMDEGVLFCPEAHASYGVSEIHYG